MVSLFFNSPIVNILSLVIYESCNEALIKNKFMEGQYYINVYGNVEKFLVFCKNFNESFYETLIDTNLEAITTVEGYEPSFGYQQTVNYSTLNAVGVNEFINIHKDCYQTMFLDITFARSNSSKLEFWDGKQFLFEEVTDGICKCIISEICLKRQNASLLCLNRAVNNIIHNPLITHFGKLSVKSGRLPLKKVFIGDTGHIVERVRYAVGKFVCRKCHSLIVKSRIACLNDEIFFDNLLSSCYTFNSGDSFLTIVSNNSVIEILGENSNCINVYLYSYMTKNIIKQCYTQNNCEFNCTKSALGLYKLHFENDGKEKKICEIRN